MFAPIRTERLLLRPVRVEDAGPLAARRDDPEVARYEAWSRPYDESAAARLVGDVMAHDGPHLDGWWMLTVADADDTVVHGDVVVRLEWDGRSAEIGYALARASWGRGYAGEATAALVARLFEDRRLTRVHALLHPDNAASARVLERTGFVYEGRTRLSYWVGDDNTDDLHYGLTRELWRRWLDRPRGAPGDVSLVELSPDNADAALRLATHRSQERFVAPMAASFADALFPEVIDGAAVVPWMRGVVADDEMVGFVMLAEVTDHHPEPYLWRLLVDRLHQGRGVGRRALELVIERLAGDGHATLLTSWVEGRGSPRPFYERLGFVPTGEIVDGETEARLTFD